MPEKVYRAAPGISQSALKKMEPTPAHFVSAMSQPQEPTRAMILGTILHQMVLQPDIRQTWVEKPKGFDGRTKEGKAWLAEIGPDRETLTYEESSDICGMAQSILRHPIAQRVCRDSGRHEVACFEDHDLHLNDGECDTPVQIRRKCLIDILADGYLADIKTTEDASEDAFSKAIFDYGYACQGAYYLDIANALEPENPKQGFVFIVVEKHPPYVVMIYELDEASIAYGRRQYQRLLRRYAQCVATGQWPGYPEKCVKVGVPDWVLRRESYAPMSMPKDIMS
jgi:hypothetical protein